VPKLASCLQIADFSRRASSFCTPHELLAAAPGVRVLATSREPLHVVGESEYPLEPLSESAASELFAARVRDNVPEFVLDDRNREVVTLICRRLDGLPLALELAAARLKLLGFQGLVDRLEQRLELLAGERRDVPERQKTLRATIQWSYDLLSEGEQAVFLKLSVFAGGFTLESAEAVCGAHLEVIGSLLEKSLLRRGETASGGVRFWMLQTIREFGLDELERSGRLHGLRGRHLRYFPELAELAEPELRRAEQMDWLQRLDAEDENLRAALAYGLGESGDLHQAALLAVALLEFWDARAHFNEAENWFNLLIASRTELNAALAARVRLARASIASRRGDRRSQIRHAADAALAFRALAAPAHEAWALDSLTYGLLYSREPHRRERAGAAAERAHDATHESGDAICHALAAAANVATRSEGDEERATSIYEEMARIYRDLGDRHKYGIVLANWPSPRSCKATSSTLRLCSSKRSPPRARSTTRSSPSSASPGSRPRVPFKIGSMRPSPRWKRRSPVPMRAAWPTCLRSRSPRSRCSQPAAATVRPPPTSSARPHRCVDPMLRLPRSRGGSLGKPV
jgi:predicted ATPase